MNTSSLRKKLVIIGLLIWVIGGIFFITIKYKSYAEVKQLANSCYDAGGLPNIEKTGLKIVHFSCE